MSLTLTNAQGIGKVIFTAREERERRSDVVVSPFGGINANPHRPATACSLFDSLGLSAAIHPAPTYLEPYTGTTLASAVSIAASAYTFFFLKDKGRYTMYFMWFVCVWMFAVSTKSLSVGNGVLAHQLGVTASGIVCIGALCKIFLDIVYAGGFGDAETAATVKKPSSSPYEPIYTKDKIAQNATPPPPPPTGTSYSHIDRTTNVVGGVTADEAAAALAAELASKGSRRIITDSEVKRRMDLMNTEYLKQQYEVATKKARTDLAAQIAASTEPSKPLLMDSSAAAVESGMSNSKKGTGLYSIGSKASGPKVSTYNHMRDAMGFAGRLVNTGAVLGKYLYRSPLLKASALAGGLTYYNFRRLEWWGLYVPELRSLKGRDNSSSGVDVYKGTYSSDIDADMLSMALALGLPGDKK